MTASDPSHVPSCYPEGSAEHQLWRGLECHCRGTLLVHGSKALRGRLLVVGHRTGLVRGGCRASEACNFGFQGLAAKACGLALWWVWNACMDPGSSLYGCHLVLVVHDELVLEAPLGREEAAKEEIERLMIAALAVCCPDVPGKVESMITRNYRK